jgi:hypothetical protein
LGVIEEVMPRKPREQTELKAASEHLHYEVWMFLTLARALATGVFGNGPINNAALESFTVHARVLLDFMFAERPREDDVIAEDFFSTPEEWPRLRGGLPDSLANLRTRVGKEITHLSYVRLTVTPDTKPWPFVTIADAIEGLVHRFIQSAPLEHLAPVWHAERERA